MITASISACPKSLAEFAARRRQIKYNPFFAAACTSQKTLLSLQVWNLFAHGEQIMRAADCEPFVQKGLRSFWTVAKIGVRREPDPDFFQKLPMGMEPSSLPFSMERICSQ